MNPDFLHAGLLGRAANHKAFISKGGFEQWANIKTSFSFIPKSQAIRTGVLSVH